MSERRRDIPGFVGYQADSDGSIWTRWKVGCKPRPTGEWRQLKSSKNSSGHLQVHLGRRYRFFVHQLIALVFIGPCPKGQEVRHFDGDPLNNNASNLLYGTRQQNCKDTVRHGRCNLINFPSKGSKHGMAKLDEAKVSVIKAALKNGWSVTATAKAWGVSISTVSLIKTGKTWRNVQ